MSYGANERKKSVGNFYHENGSVMVNIVYEERSVYVGSNHAKFSLPVALEFVTGGTQVRIRADDVRGFVGMLSGTAEEFNRSRDAVVRKLEKLGIYIDEQNGG